MIAVIEQTLGHIHRRHSCRLILQTIKDEFMTAEAIDRQLIDILQRLLDVVGIERSQRSYLLDMLATQREDIGIGTHHHPEVAVIR